MSSRRLNSFQDRLVWGLEYGLGMALICCLFVAAMAIFRGSTSYEKYGLSIWRICGIYIALGVLGGALIALMRPLVRGRVSAVMVGMLTGAFVYTAIGFAIQDLGKFVPIANAVVGALIGGVFGYALWGED